MLVTRKSFSLVAILFFAVVAYGQGEKITSDYLDLKGPITLNKESFFLAWSSHPSPNYYKQEYLPAKQKADKYTKMVMVEVLVGDASALDLANAKIVELKKLQETNPLVNHEVFQKNGEVIVDFLISLNSADGKRVEVIERNVYRYKQITEKNGQQGVMLFGISERAYGNDVDVFLSALKRTRSALLNAVAAYRIPELRIAK